MLPVKLSYLIPTLSELNLSSVVGEVGREGLEPSTNRL